MSHCALQTKEPAQKPMSRALATCMVWRGIELYVGSVRRGARAADIATERRVVYNYEAISHLATCQLTSFSWLICQFNSELSYVGLLSIRVSILTT